MTLAKASLIAMGFVGSMALGVWMAPYVTDRDTRASDTTAAITEPSTDRALAAPTRTTPASEARVAPTRISTVAPSAPALHARLKPVLSSGTNIEMAAEGFNDSEQFATLAHLSRNTGVPFVLLKHRVLNEGRSMDEAVKMSKPDVDATLEIDRARAAARADLWATV